MPDQSHHAAHDADQLGWAVWTTDGHNEECYAVVADSKREAREKAEERHGEALGKVHIDGPFQDAEPGVFRFEYITRHRETITVEAPTEEYARESASANRNYSGEYIDTVYSETRKLDTETGSEDE
ncbi:hypothetical protein EXE48_11545 [Halorubrum sp. ASP1]|uniref:hypothetical protein n=1 Tax=Halorubrum sp. ASP1 TaxID=2518114 RepID=UPI0010FA5DA8|nr:hypothetical protein [Halorubrum sp. ASP1]TKX60599.1 hypothetical protein EXE48_11545 [Halorubrum sp. ASP1]